MSNDDGEDLEPWTVEFADRVAERACYLLFKDNTKPEIKIEVAKAIRTAVLEMLHETPLSPDEDE